MSYGHLMCREDDTVPWIKIIIIIIIILKYFVNLSYFKFIISRCVPTNL